MQEEKWVEVLQAAGAEEKKLREAHRQADGLFAVKRSRGLEGEGEFELAQNQVQVFQGQVLVYILFLFK